MQSSWRLGAISAIVILMWSCGGSGGGYSSTTPSAPSASTPASSTPAPSTPAPTPTPSAPTVTVNIVGSAGSGAYVPNPVQLAAGGQVVWKNNDTTAHHIVLDDGSADVGEIAPGATSRAATLRSAAGNFHCTLHPTMVGSINGSIAAPPSPTDPPRDDGY